MHASEPKPARWWPLITIVSVVFVVPVLILVWAVGTLGGSIDVAVRNDSGETLRDVRVTIDDRVFELGALENASVSAVDQEFETPISVRVSAKIGRSDSRTESKAFSRDPVRGEATRLLLVLSAEQRWLLRRR